MKRENERKNQEREREKEIQKSKMGKVEERRRRVSHRIKRWAEKRARRRREEQERRGEKRAEVSQTGPLTRDTRRAYKVHDNTTLRKEKERLGLCSVFVHETRSERWTIAPSFPSKHASAISIRRNYT